MTQGLFIELWRIGNIILAGWVLAWMPIVYRQRVAADDQMHGELLAVALALLMLSVIVGNVANIADHRVFAAGMPFTTAGLLVAAWARHEVKST